MTNVSIDVPVEVKINNAGDFTFWATLLGVEVPARGRKPFGKLVRAVQAHPVHTLVDTDYCNAAMGEAKSSEPSEYGAKLKVARAARDKAIADAHTEFENIRTALRAEYNVPDNSGERGSQSTGNAYRVSARVPQIDRETGEVKRTKAQGDKPGKVRFGTSPKSVTLTPAQVRELAPGAGERGRPSKAHTLYAAVVAGEWFPAELMSVDGWETVLLSDVSIEPVTVELESESAAS